ncbi:MAG: hypothetical protein M1415_11780 [Firmicutes bacterium]|nr:hypothetical protein [Bacillota bacterium]MCL5065407.1 hypothetical protein [Bacillota bacterium]
MYRSGIDTPKRRWLLAWEILSGGSEPLAFDAFGMAGQPRFLVGSVQRALDPPSVVWIQRDPGCFKRVSGWPWKGGLVVVLSPI